MSRLRVAAALLLATGAIACEAPVGPEVAPQFARSPNAPAHQVSGAGQVDYSAVIPGYGPEIYGFNASVDGGGAVKGQFESHWASAGGDFRFHLDITCLSVSGNRAWLGGVTTRSNDPAFPVGTEWIWSVTDNGEGNGAPADQLSYFYRVPAGSCVDQYTNIGSFDWTQGNVQVR